MHINIIVAIIALIASVFATVTTVVSQRNIKILERKIRRQEESDQFIAQKLEKFYLPVQLQLATTKKLFDRFFIAGEQEKEAIEHELLLHNSKIRDCLMSSSIFLEDDIPPGMIDALLEHLIQWEIVYKLKYEYKVYEGPVFAGIKEFGFCGFPQMDVDGYFKRKVSILKEKHHQRFQEVM